MDHWEDYDFDLADLKECIYTNIMIAALQLLLIAIAFASVGTLIATLLYQVLMRPGI